MIPGDDGMSGALVFNGVDGRTGRFLSAPATEREFAQRIREEPLDRRHRRDRPLLPIYPKEGLSPQD